VLCVSEPRRVFAREWNISAVVPEVRRQATAAQPQKQQGKRLNVGLPDNSELSPQLQQEWHPDNNALLGGTKIKPHSKRKVLWSCPNCPAGCPHVWKSAVYSRTNGTKRPYCQGKSVCQHSSLATRAPRQTRYWNHGSVGNSYKQPTIEAAQHPLLLEWDYERNSKDGIHPQNTTLGSKRLVHWVCHNCPKGQLHLYQMMPQTRR